MLDSHGERVKLFIHLLNITIGVTMIYIVYEYRIGVTMIYIVLRMNIQLI